MCPYRCSFIQQTRLWMDGLQPILHTHTHTHITSQCGWLIAVLTRIRAFCFAVFHFGPFGVGERDVPRPRAFSSTLGTHLPAECRSDQNPFHSHSEFHSLRVECKMSAPQNWSTQFEKRGRQAKSQAKSGDARLWCCCWKSQCSIAKFPPSIRDSIRNKEVDEEIPRKTGIGNLTGTQG